MELIFQSINDTNIKDGSPVLTIRPSVLSTEGPITFGYDYIYYVYTKDPSKGDEQGNFVPLELVKNAKKTIKDLEEDGFSLRLWYSSGNFLDEYDLFCDLSKLKTTLRGEYKKIKQLQKANK